MGFSTYCSMSDQITKQYYDFLVGEINRGVTTKEVYRLTHYNGNFEYFTYHIFR